MIIYKVFIPFFLFVRSEHAEKVDDPCSEFPSKWNSSQSLSKCPSGQPDEDYLECYDLSYKEVWYTPPGLLHFCWSRFDNTDDDLKTLIISATGTAGYNFDNSEVNDIINKPFTTRFYVNDTHITCHNNEEWSTAILDNGYGDEAYVYCHNSWGIDEAVWPPILFHYDANHLSSPL